MDGPLPKLCPAVMLSQDGHHSAVALLLKAALIQVSDYRLLGASGLSGVHAAKSLVSRVDHCFPLSLGHCIACPSNYSF